MAILNYGVGNLRSISKGLENAGACVEVTHSPDFGSLDGLILPGVGAFKAALAHINRYRDEITSFSQDRLIMGVCLGLQLLFTRSFEGGLNPGLNLIHGDVIMLPRTVKLPHIGWNTVRIIGFDQILEGIKDEDYFYFVHSYYGKPVDGKVILATSDHGTEFPAIIRHGNIYATQFHPEKSGEAGLKMLRNLVSIAKR
ncbi:MAG: imidazole glycerol phosphate synthase subunit HisH [Candidatus Bathyarchaeia archaeon]